MQPVSVPGLKGVKLAPKSPRPKPIAFNLSASDQQAFVDWLTNEIQNAKSARAYWTAEGGFIDQCYCMYEQTPRGVGYGHGPIGRQTPWPDAADLASWIPTEKVDALRARLMQIIFGVEPICLVEGWGEDPQRAAKVEAFLEWKADDERLRTWMSKAIHASLVEGTGILEVSERARVQKISREMRVNHQLDDQGLPMLDEQGRPIPKPSVDGTGFEPWDGNDQTPSLTLQVNDTNNVCDGPQYRVLSGKDFLMLPVHARDISEVWGFAKRIYRRLPELQQRGDDGYYANVDLLGGQGDRFQTMEDTRQGVTIAPQVDETAEKELWEVQLLYDIDDDGIEEWLITTITGVDQSSGPRVLLRLQPDDLGRPRYECFTPFPRARGVWGYSFVGDKLWTLSDEHTALRNMKADRQALATNAPIKRLTTAKWNPDEQPWGASVVIDVRDMGELQQMTVADVPASTIQSEQTVLNAAERVSGLNDQSVVGAGADGGVPTATQVQTQAHASFVRVDETIYHLQTSVANVYALRQAIWERTLASGDGLNAPQSIMKGLETRGITLPETGPFKFTADDLRGNWRYKPRGSVETADVYRLRDDENQFMSAFANWAKLFPQQFQQLQGDPKFAQELLKSQFRLYRMNDLLPTIAQAGQPQQPGAAPAPGLPPGQGAPADPAALLQQLLGQGGQTQMTGAHQPPAKPHQANVSIAFKAGDLQNPDVRKILNEEGVPVDPAPPAGVPQ